MIKYICYLLKRGRCTITPHSGSPDGDADFPREVTRPGLRIDFGHRMRGWYMLELCATLDPQACSATFSFQSRAGEMAHPPLTLHLASNRLTKRLIHLPVSPAEIHLTYDIVPRGFHITRLRMIPVTRRFAMDRMLRKIGHAHLRLKNPDQTRNIVRSPEGNAIMETTYRAYRAWH